MSVAAILWSVVLTLLSLCGMLFCWWLKSQLDNARAEAASAHARAEAASAAALSEQAKLADFKTYCATTFSTKADLRDVAEKFERTAERIFERIDDLATRVLAAPPPR